MAIRRLITTAIDSLSLPNTTSSTSNTTGALTVAGGAGIRGNLYATAVYAANYYYANSAPFVSGSTYTLPAATTSTLGGVIADGSTITVAANGRISASNTLPSQTGNSGKYLTTDGSVSSWSNVSALPSQSGNSGKYLTTDGTNSSWSNVTTLPTQTANSGKFLTTNGTTASWANVSVTPTAVSDQQNSSTGAFALPVGNTAQRPATAYNGYYRVNTTTSNVEMYYNGAWYNMQYIGAITATGGTVTTSGNYKIHTFTQSGTFTVTDAPVGATVEVLIVGGGGGGGISLGGGGGGGAVFYNAAKTMSAGTYGITIGAGGTYTAVGSSTLAFGETVTGGGGGADRNNTVSASAGANGGGGATDSRTAGATGVVPSKADNSFTVYAGRTGGSGPGGGGNYPGGGGAGAGANGVTPVNNSANGGAGGAGVSISVTGFGSYYWAGGGGGSVYVTGIAGAGGYGGGGGAASGAGAGTGGAGGTLGINIGGAGPGVGGNDSPTGGAGGANTGGGGGSGAHGSGLGGTGGSGIVIISYRYQ
jgi:hypothetical protein